MIRKKLLLSGFLLVFGLTGVYSQKMELVEKTGEKTVYDLQNIKKMSFSSNNLVIAKIDKSSRIYSLESIQKMGFSTLVTDVEKAVVLEDEGLFKIYPNPVNDVINILLNEKGLLNILTADGKNVYSKEVGAGFFSLDISTFVSGIYICQYNNGTVIKTERIIKR